MSTSSTVLLPALYSIQKDLEDMHRRYGKTCLDSNQGGGKTIPKTVIQNFYTNVTQYLIRYNMLRITIDKTRQQKLKLLLVFYLLYLFLIIGGFIAFICFFIIPRIKIALITKDSIQWFEIVYFTILSIIIFVYLIIVGAKIYDKKQNFYNKMFNTPCSGNAGVEILGEPIIRQITDLCVFNKAPEKKELELEDSTCPAIAYHMCKYKGWNTCPSGEEEEGEATKPAATASGTDRCAACIKSGDDIYAGCRFGNAVDPYLVYRKLQRYDLAFQASRISDSVAFMKNFMLKERDMVGGPTKEKSDQIINKVSSLLMVNYSRLKDFYIHVSPDVGTIVDTYTADETHSSCLSEDKYVMAVFNDSAGFGTLYTASDLDNLILIYAPKGTKNHDILIKHGVKVKVSGTSTVTEQNGQGIPLTLPLATETNRYNYTGGDGEMCSILTTDFSSLNNTSKYFDCGRLSLDSTYKDVFNKEAGDSDIQTLTNSTTPSRMSFIKFDFAKEPGANIGATIDSLSRILVRSIVQKVRTEDSTMTFVIEDKITSKIKSALTTFYASQYPSVSVQITKIIDDAKVELDRLRYQSIDPNTPASKYINYDRFVSKIREMKQDSFINEFFYHIDEIRHTSSGLKNLYNIYNYSTDSSDVDQYILLMTFIIFCIVGGLEVVRYGAFEIFVRCPVRVLDVQIADLEKHGYIDFNKFVNEECGHGKDHDEDVQLECPTTLMSEEKRKQYEEMKDKKNDKNDDEPSSKVIETTTTTETTYLYDDANNNAVQNTNEQDQKDDADEQDNTQDGNPKENEDTGEETEADAHNPEEDSAGEEKQADGQKSNVEGKTNNTDVHQDSKKEGTGEEKTDNAQITAAKDNPSVEKEDSKDKKEGKNTDVHRDSKKEGSDEVKTDNAQPTDAQENLNIEKSVGKGNKVEIKPVAQDNPNVKEDPARKAKLKTELEKSVAQGSLDGIETSGNIDFTNIHNLSPSQLKEAKGLVDEMSKKNPAMAKSPEFKKLRRALAIGANPVGNFIGRKLFGLGKNAKKKDTNEGNTLPFDNNKLELIKGIINPGNRKGARVTESTFNMPDPFTKPPKISNYPPERGFVVGGNQAYAHFSGGSRCKKRDDDKENAHDKTKTARDAIHNDEEDTEKAKKKKEEKERLEKDILDKYKFKKNELEIKKYVVENLAKRISKEGVVEAKNVEMDAYLKVALAFTIYIIILAMFYAWMEKNKAIIEFNQMTLESNGDTIERSAQDAFDTIVDGFIVNGKFIQLNMRNVSEEILDNTDSDIKYRLIQQNSPSKDQPVILTDQDDIIGIYDNLIAILEAYDKCNTLLLNADQKMPFPMLEVAIYLILLVILLIVSTVVVIKLKPYERIIQIKIWNKLREKLSQNMDIDAEDQDFCTEEDLIDHMDTDSTIKLVTIILLPIFTVLFATTLMGNSDTFKLSLYTSDLFRNMDCYKI